MLTRLKKLPVPVLVGVMLLLVFPSMELWDHSTLRSRVLHHCFSPSEDLESCYMDYYEQLSKEGGSRVALSQMTERKKDDTHLASNCHEAMHEVGRAAYDEYGSIAEAYAHADYSCWGGYLHGVVEAALRGKKMSDIGSTTVRSMCDGAKEGGERSFEYFSCVHGLGHALMFVSDNDLPGSLTRCDDLGNTWKTRQCANGALMQNMFSNWNGHASDYAEKDDLRYPCDVVRADVADICYQVRGKEIAMRLDWDLDRAFTFCSTLATSTLRVACGSGLGAVVSNYSGYKPQKISALCARAGGDLDASCLMGALADLEGVTGGTDAGVKVCDARTSDKRELCMKILENAHASFPGKAVNE